MGYLALIIADIRPIFNRDYKNFVAFPYLHGWLWSLIMGYFRDWIYILQSLELVNFFTLHDGKRKGVKNILNGNQISRKKSLLRYVKIQPVNEVQRGRCWWARWEQVSGRRRRRFRTKRPWRRRSEQFTNAVSLSVALPIHWSWRLIIRKLSPNNRKI